MKFSRAPKRKLSDPYERGAHTFAAFADDRLDLWPWWLERQRRPGFAGSVGEGDLGLIENTTGRTWTSLGALDGPGCTVDPAGLVTPDEADWSLDWWVGAEDRWHFPSREANVRQDRSGAAPVVSTYVRVPGGDIAQRVFGATASDGTAVTIVEIENLTPVPVAIALAVRPYGPLGLGRLGHISSYGNSVELDGRLAIRFDREPAHIALDGEHDCLAAVIEGDAVATAEASTSSRDDLATAAWIFPLTHTATLRLWLGASAPNEPAVTAEEITAGWGRHLDKAARVEFSDPLLDDAYRAATAHLLRVAGTGFAVAPRGRESTWSFDDSLVLVDAIGRCGLTVEAADQLGNLLRDDRQSRTTPERVARVLDVVATAYERSGDPSVVGLTLGTTARLLDQSTTKGSRALSSLAGAFEAIEQPDLAEVARQRSVEPVLSRRSGFATEVLDATDFATSIGGTTEALARLLRIGLPTAAWPTSVHPRVDSGSAGSGHDPVSSAAVVEALSRLAVAETADGLDLLPVFDTDWLGRAVEIHDLGTRFGPLSFAIRWHGARPALLWELVPTWTPESAPMIRATRLDPAWSTDEIKGETLLAEPASEAISDTPISFG